MLRLLGFTCLLVIGLPSFACVPGAAAEVWAERDRNLGGIDAAYRRCEGNHVATRYGVSYYADQRFLYEGITSSVRFFMNDIVSPFVGIGVLAGVGGYDADASADGLDNNRDGRVDEPDESTRRLVASAFVYPELGVVVGGQGVGITLSAKRYYGTQFTGHIIYSVGLLYTFTSTW